MRVMGEPLLYKLCKGRSVGYEINFSLEGLLFKSSYGI